jgi:hypothetical protein
MIVKIFWLCIKFTFLIVSGKLTFIVILSKQSNRNYSLERETSTQYLRKTVLKRLQQTVLFVIDLGTETSVLC